MRPGKSASTCGEQRSDFRCPPCVYESRPPPAAFRFAQDVVPVSEWRELSGADHPVQTYHQRLALDVELGLFEIIDDVLHRQPSRVFRQNIHDEIFYIISAAAASRYHHRRQATRL